jgi:hypothetical protein
MILVSMLICLERLGMSLHVFNISSSIAIITDDKLVVANVGDSRVIIGQKSEEGHKVLQISVYGIELINHAAIIIARTNQSISESWIAELESTSLIQKMERRKDHYVSSRETSHILVSLSPELLVIPAL